MNLIVRHSKVTDSEVIAQLSLQLGYLSNQNAIQNRLSKIIQDSNHCVLVALINEQIVGWIHGFYALKIESDPFVEIGGLVVDSNFQKLGIGKELVNEISKWAATTQSKKVRVRCNTIRKEAHIFYEKIGFTINKEQKIFDQKIP